MTSKVFRIAACIVCLIAVLITSLASADSFPGWRTDGTGKYPSATPPVTWSPTQNVMWSTPMPAFGNSIPMLVGGRLFVCVEPSTLVCVNPADGKILWQRTNNLEDLAPASQRDKIKADQARTHELQGQAWKLDNEIKKWKTDLQDKPDNADLKAKIAAAEQTLATVNQELAPLLKTWYLIPPTHPINGFTSATPTTDGKRVFMVLGTGVVAAYDLYGTRLWAKVIEKPNDVWGHATSPVIADGKLIVHYLSLTALDPATGKVIWQDALPKSYGTPAVTHIGDTEVIITAAGNVVRASDGVSLARIPCALEYDSPVVEKDVVYFIQNGGRAMQLPAAVTGNTAALTQLWTTSPRKDRYYGSPVVHDGLIYACTQANAFSVIDAATGAIVYEKLLPLGKGTVYPSVTLAGDKLFVSSDNGKTLVIKPGREYVQLAALTLAPFRSSPVFVGDKVYVRALQNLYCLGASEAK